ncbi:MAG: T9SS type A sorting domain-containing protein [Lewinella sp.]|nr:T9SS type A sorting domain-containing protein [Lewinella sp.]
MKRIFVLFCGFFSVCFLGAQSNPVGCGYDHYVQAMEAAHPGFREAMDQAWPRLHTGQATPRDLEVYTIPVVVHVVWQEESQNLSDSLVQDVIKGLNEDYRRLNADASNVRDVFASRVGDPFIEFELVGVERVFTEATFELDLFGGALPDNVKQTSEGGSDAWPTDQYLNIWVCNLEGGSLLGYAYPPADRAHWPADAAAPSPELDGVVIHTPAFRRTGEYTASGLLGGGDMTVPIRGRTVTHEVGHYLGLRHIWGDGLLSIFGLPDCDADDGVADTPNQGTNSQFACDEDQNTCEEAEGEDLPDMFENYMDYASEDCMNSFTQGQIAIMRGVLEQQRSGLIGGTVATDSPRVNTGELRVFPNPAHELVTLELPAGGGEGQLLIWNAQGQLLWQKKMATGAARETIFLGQWGKGTYTLQWLEHTGVYTTRVLVQ